jgi:hypothetical protein
VAGTVLFALMPYLVWHQTWFGRRLSNEELGRYLDDTSHSRHIQHALFQMAERMDKGDPSVRAWYPRMIKASRNPQIEIRTVAAWAMGHDSRSGELRAALLPLLHDPEVLVRWNAALALVKLGDSSGHDELAGILQPHPIAAGHAGTVTLRVRAAQDVERGTVIATIRTPDNRDAEVRAPFPGRVDAVLAAAGSHVDAASPVARLRAGQEEVWEALRGLYLMGRPGDLAAVEALEREPALSERTREQATITARAIRTRPEPNPSR